MKQKTTRDQRRKYRVRNKVRANCLKMARPRLSVYRTGKNLHVQVIDDRQGVTLASASTIEADLKSKLKSGSNVAAAEAVGKAVAERAKKAGVKEVIFDRGAYLYHGRVKALAEAARAGGLEF